jgi:ankyrin repeat protein
LTKGANPNLSNALGQTALMLAAQTEQPEVMQRLIEAGARPEQQNAAGKTAADFARISNCTPCLLVLKKQR